MKVLTFLFLILVSSTMQAQDNITTSAGDLTIRPITHGTVVLQFQGKNIYVDPHGDISGFAGIPDPDLILITDIHGDHMNKGTLAALNTSNAQFVVPKAVADQLPDEYKDQLTLLGNGETMKWEGLTIAAIPMYNLPESPDSRHTKGRGNGYIVDFADKKVYLSGDTEDIQEMRTLTDIDVAFVCMNMPYTMTVEQAASAVLDFEPAIVYPYHYRGSDTNLFKKLVDEGGKKIEVRLRNWYK